MIAVVLKKKNLPVLTDRTVFVGDGDSKNVNICVSFESADSTF